MRTHLKKLVKECNCKIDVSKNQYGTWSRYLDPALRKRVGHYAKVRYKLRPTIKEVLSELEKGSAIIFCYAWKENGEESGHYTTIIPHDGKLVKYLNDSIHRGAVCMRRLTSLRHDLYNRKIDDRLYPKAWFITKK